MSSEIENIMYAVKEYLKEARQVYNIEWREIKKKEDKYFVCGTAFSKHRIFLFKLIVDKNGYVKWVQDGMYAGSDLMELLESENSIINYIAIYPSRTMQLYTDLALFNEIPLHNEKGYWNVIIKDSANEKTEYIKVITDCIMLFAKENQYYKIKKDDETATYIIL